MSDFGKVCIAVPYEWAVPGEFFDVFNCLTANGIREGDAVISLKELPTHRSRNEIVRGFLRLCRIQEESGEEPFGSLCFIDSDMYFSVKTLEMLRDSARNQEYDVVQAWYCTKHWPPLPIMLRKSAEDAAFGVEGWWWKWVQVGTDWLWGDLVEVDGLGMGFTLIKRHVFEKLIDGELEHTCWYQYHNDSSEDLYFCKKAREAGFRLAVDTSVTIGHVERAIAGKTRYMEWRNGVASGKYDENGKEIGLAPPACEDVKG